VQIDKAVNNVGRATKTTSGRNLKPERRSGLAKAHCRNAEKARRHGRDHGEPSAAIVPAAIGNAVFEATGARLRSVPFAPAKVKAALGAA
jgi:hypothetical protein